jgi:GTP-binding protein
MTFVDKVSIKVTSGNGGNGKLSFHREKFITKGGPDGGNGGNGADIVLKASRNQNTLAAFRYQKGLRAENGMPGGQNRKHGRSAKDMIVAVPIGTIATNSEGRVVADLTEDDQLAIVAKGGRGGFGNAHFVSSVRQAPNFAEKGEPGEVAELQFELKMIADVGLVGLPNAGKSTLLSKLSNARPEIADYPFTTLTPNLGVVDIDSGSSVLFADIPGLIEGAADFLRHIERTAVILHLIDAYNPDVVQDYQTIRAELEAYQPELIKRPEIIALNKIEGLGGEIVADLLNQLKRAAHDDAQLFAISAQSGAGLKPLLFSIKDAVNTARVKPPEEISEPAIPVISLPDDGSEWNVLKDDKAFVVTGRKIEQFAHRTDFTNEQAVQRLRDIMRRAGIMHELRRQGVEAGQIVQIGKSGEFTY